MCKQPIGTTQQSSKLTEKGCQSIANASTLRGEDVSPSVGDIVHVDCRRKFVHPREIQKDIQCLNATPAAAFPEDVQLRSKGEFHFERHCFYCTQPAKVDGRKRGFDVYPVSIIQMKGTILSECRNRDDAWGRDVMARLECCNDLPAVEAVYHQVCSVNFRTGRALPQAFATVKSPKIPKGRPQQKNLDGAFRRVVEYLKENEDEPIMISELVNRMRDDSGESYSNKHMKNRIVEHFGSSVQITNLIGKPDIVTFKRTSAEILHDFFQQQQNKNEDDTKKDVIRTAARLLRQDMMKLKSTDLTYPCTTDVAMIQNHLDFLPEDLVFFLRQLTTIKNPDLKIASIGQAIVQFALPRTTIAPLHIGLAVQMHHQFASKFLVDTLNSLGFCSSYSEVQKFEANAAACHGQEEDKLPDSCNVQFVADNVDHNINTIDGHGTFHGMGIIMSVTPLQKSTRRVPRLSVNMEEIAAINRISIDFHNLPDKAMSFLKYQDIDTSTDSHANYAEDLGRLHLLSKLIWPIKPKAMEWNGFMQAFQQGEYPGQSSIMFLPMIDLNPGDPTCIYSTLKFVHSEAKRWNKQPVLTFDQPLYWKALAIISSAEEGDFLKSMVLRLGPFHMQMSFLGCIGYFMQCSGLKEVLETVYASCSVDQMLTGKAVSRAVRGHFLIDSVLTILLFCKANTTDLILPVEEENYSTSLISGNERLSGVLKLFDEFSEMSREKDKSMTLEEDKASDITPEEDKSSEMTQEEIQSALDWSVIDGVKSDLNEIVKTIAQTGNRTALLWLQYMEIVEILRNFITAERTGDWSLHLSTVKQMLPYYAAAGHNQYTKSAYLYYQQMSNLPVTNPDVYKAFAEGYHVIRRSDRFWAGLSTDLIIEQVLMRSVKATGGMTRGKGMTEVQRAQWLLSTPDCAAMNFAMQELTNTKFHSSEQHKESGEERIKRDFQDKIKFLYYMRERNPFNDGTTLRNIESGVTCDETVTVDRAKDIGEQIVQSMKDQTVSSFSFKKSNRAVPMNSKCSITIDGEREFVDPQLLFQRLLAASNNIIDDKAEIFRYELTSVPPALFDEHGLMRLSQKSQLADMIWNLANTSTSECEIAEIQTHVVDGGSLLHRIPWSNGTTYEAIFSSYADYVVRNFRGCTVVFDGYEENLSTKDSTHLRRSKGAIGTVVQFTERAPFRGKKDIFLNNKENKEKFLKMLGHHLEQRGIDVRYATGDADLLVVQTAKEKAESSPVVVVGEDTDILVLLIHYASSTQHQIFMRSSATSTTKKIWNIRKAATALGSYACRVLPVVHAITGCDTTSRLFGVGKGSAMKEIRSNIDLRDSMDVFMRTSPKEEVIKAGEDIIVHLYKGIPHEGLDFLRFRLFGRKTVFGTKVLQVQKLPPTSDAASLHSMRVYHQVQHWLGNELDSCEWGWYASNENLLLPIKATLPPGPQELLKVIRCSCKTGCDSMRCGCRKHGLKCTQICGECRGHGCTNSENVEVE